MKLPAKFKKNLYSGFRATLILRFFKGGCDSVVHTVVSWPFSNNKGVTKFKFLRYEQVKPKYRVFSLGFPVAKVTYYITIMTTFCLEIISVSYGTIVVIRLLLHDTVL